MHPYAPGCNVMPPDMPMCAPRCGHSACTDFPPLRPYAAICTHMHLDAMSCRQICQCVRPAAGTVRALTFRLCGHMRTYARECTHMRPYAPRGNVMRPDTLVCEARCGHSACTDFLLLRLYATICAHVRQHATICAQMGQYASTAQAQCVH